MKFLSDLTILDLSSLLPCPFASHLLAALGAKVIKIESPSRPDPAREFGHRPKDGGPGYAYQAINEKKQLVWLDLKHEGDRKKLYDLVRSADGAIEGYRPDVKKRLGIEFETLSAVNPGFVLCSVSGFAPGGPLALRAGHDVNFVARSGILDLTRDHKGTPVLPGLPLGDVAVAYSASLRFLAALHFAKTTGKGAHVFVDIEEALREAQLPFLNEFKHALADGEVVRAGQTLPTGKYPCYAIYACGTGHLAVGALEPKFWEAFCNAIKRPDLIARQYATGGDAIVVKEQIEAVLSTHSFESWKSVFSQIDCCVEPVLSIEDVVTGAPLNGVQS